MTFLGQDIRGNLVGGTMGAIQSDSHPAQQGAERHRALTEFDITPRRIIDSGGFPYMG